jgi:hypothetical protein
VGGWVSEHCDGGTGAGGHVAQTPPHPPPRPPQPVPSSQLLQSPRQAARCSCCCLPWHGMAWHQVARPTHLLVVQLEPLLAAHLAQLALVRQVAQEHDQLLCVLAGYQAPANRGGGGGVIKQLGGC